MRFRTVIKLLELIVQMRHFPSVRKYVMPGLVFGVKTFLGLTKLIMMDKQELNVIGVKNEGK